MPREGAKGSALDTGQIQKVTEKYILPATTYDSSADAVSKNPFGFICAVGVIGDAIETNDLKEEELIAEISH
jgi:hypothetical protein